VRVLKILGIALAAYVGLVVVFESLIGVLQPAGETTLVITTTDADGKANDRVLAKLESGGHLYVAANHWPRDWYEQALANPDVQIALGGQQNDYRASPVSSEEHDRVNSENNAGVLFKILTGFPPREFLRLDPR
jgi:hypothetical protein